MKYLVTGATGFLGTHLVEALRATGDEVVPFARSTGGDVLDPRRLEQAAAGCDGVFHCAGMVSRKPEDAETLYRVHVEGTRNVIDAAQARGVKRVVVASTSGVVAVSEDREHVANENDATPAHLVMRWPYYRAKMFAEQLALRRNGSGVEVVCVNPSLMLGPGDVRGSSNGDVRTFLEGRVWAVLPGGISIVDVRDVALAMRLAMVRGRPGERYLVGACNLTVGDFLRRLARVSGVAAPWLPMPRSRKLARVAASWIERGALRLGLDAPIDSFSAEMAACYWYLDAGKARAELGWAGRDASLTLYDTVEDMRARGVVWPRDDRRAAPSW